MLPGLGIPIMSTNAAHSILLGCDAYIPEALYARTYFTPRMENFVAATSLACEHGATVLSAVGFVEVVAVRQLLSLFVVNYTLRLGNYRSIRHRRVSLYEGTLLLSLFEVLVIYIGIEEEISSSVNYSAIRKSTVTKYKSNKKMIADFETRNCSIKKISPYLKLRGKILQSGTPHFEKLTRKRRSVGEA